MSKSSAEQKSKKRAHFNDVDGEQINHKKSKKKKKANLKEELIEAGDENNHIEDEENVGHPNTKINIKEVEGDTWTEEEYLELIRRMEEQIPKNDRISFSNRVEKLDWEQVRFGTHTVDECYERWKVIRSKIRHFRLLGEVLQDAKVWAKTPWVSLGSKRKSRHPEQPARPLSSFMLFYMDKKSKIIKRHPDLKLTDISRIIGEKYKALSEEKKKYYIEKARQMQEEYRQNLSKFYEKYPELMKVTKKPLATTNKPLPPFKIYLREKMQKHQNDENFSKQEYNEKYKEMWKNLSQKKKAYWIRIAKEEEDKYLEHLYEEEHNNEDGNKSTATYKSVISKEENAILDRLAGKPEKPPNSAYSLFSRLMLQDKDKHFVDGEPKNRMREIANKWKELPEEKKKAYAEKVLHMHENYKLEFANYLESLPEEKRAEELAKLQPKKRPVKTRQKVIKQEPGIASSQKSDLFKNEPEKPPVTAWDLFKTEFVKKNSHLPTKVAFRQAASMWKNLPRNETEKYKKKHKQLKEKFMIDFEVFLNTLTEDELKQFSALKTARSGTDKLNEDSVEEESSSDEDEDEKSTGSTTDSSEAESDSGVSEEEGY